MVYWTFLEAIFYNKNNVVIKIVKKTKIQIK
jgi:hypothetical protein